MRRATTICAAWLALAATPAAAASPLVFSPPQVVGTGGASPALALGPAGEAVAAWSGTESGPGIFVASRPSGAAAFGSPSRLTEAKAGGPLIARSDRGDVAVAWAEDREVEHVSVAPPGQGYAPPEAIPVPPRAPVKPGNENVTEEGTRSEWLTGLAVAADGSLTVGVRETDYRADGTRIYVVTRAPNGTWGEPQILDERGSAPPQVAADGVGGVAVLWAGAQDGAQDTPRAIYVAERRAPSLSFGPRRAISTRDTNNDNGYSRPELHANRRGELLALWNGGEGLIPGGVFTARRPAGGAWEPPARVADGARPSAALNEAGDAVAAFVGQGLGTVFRPAGGPFGPAEGTYAGRDQVEQLPVVLDALGNAVLLRLADGHLRAFLRPRGGGLLGPVEISAPGEATGAPAAATDPLGNGVVSWVVRRGGVSTVLIADYSARPPQLSGVAVTPNAITLAVDEPARVRVTVAGSRGRSASVTTTAPARRATRIPFDAAMRRLVRRPGRYRASIRARDLGPGVTTRRIAFRRR